MTPPPAAAAAAPRTRSTGSRNRSSTGRRTAPARRLSGPLRGPAAAAAGAGTTIALPLGRRLARAAAAAPDHPLIERMVRGRTWIGVLAFMLIGIVFMQVTLLQMNAGIGRAVESSASLDRANGELRVQVSRLSSGERIQAMAARFGMITPVGGQLSSAHSFLSRDAANAAKALRSGSFGPGSEPVPIKTTEAVPVTPATTAPVAAAPVPAATGASGATGTAGATGATGAPVQAATTPQAPAVPAQGAAAPTTGTPVATPPAVTPPPTPTPPGTPTGGATAPR